MYKNVSIPLYPDATVHTEKMAEAILLATDWTQLPDSGLTDACVTLFSTYRASVRAIRKNPTASPVWPTAPTEEWS